VNGDYDVTPLTVLGALAVYALILAAYWVALPRIAKVRPRIDRVELPTAVAIGLVWAVSVFVANYVLYRAGAMSFLPWVTNFLHTFVWIGVCLTIVYMGVREVAPMWAQFLVFFALSLVVKLAERVLFGTWELDNFFGIPSNVAYIVGWSLADGTYPMLTRFVLRRVAAGVPKLVPT
jgi:hypothetical protein